MTALDFEQGSDGFDRTRPCRYSCQDAQRHQRYLGYLLPPINSPCLPSSTVASQGPKAVLNYDDITNCLVIVSDRVRRDKFTVCSTPPRCHLLNSEIGRGFWTSLRCAGSCSPLPRRGPGTSPHGIPYPTGHTLAAKTLTLCGPSGEGAAVATSCLSLGFPTALRLL